MRELKRIKRITKLFEKAWLLQNQQRLGQLLINIIGTPDIFYIEDDEIEKILNEYLLKNK